MAWTSIPNFGDDHARINERMHSSGARLVEVLYGARDEMGQPVDPESEADGHGHWLALEIEGTYQMLSWRHPASEGGHQEYGQSRSDNALNDLEEDLRQKQGIVARAEALTHSSDWRGTAKAFDQLMEEWKRIYHWHTPLEKELWERFRTAKSRFYEQRNEERQKCANIKKDIIAQAQGLASSNDFKVAGQGFKDLMEKWKQAGSAGKDADEPLWKEFNGIRQAFYDRKKAHYEELNRQRANAAAQKTRILQEATAIANSCDYSQENTNRMKNLDAEWKNAGSAGRENEEQLWNLFQQAKTSFWEGKRRYAEQRQQEWRIKQQQAIYRKREQISNLEDQISNLQMKMYGMRNQDYIANMSRWIDEKREKIRELEIAIRDIESKM